MQQVAAGGGAVVGRIQIDNQPIALGGGAPDIEGSQQQKHEQHPRSESRSQARLWIPAAGVRECLASGRCRLRSADPLRLCEYHPWRACRGWSPLQLSAAWNPSFWRRATVSFNSASFSEIRLLSVATRVRSAGSSATKARSLFNSVGRAATAGVVCFQIFGIAGQHEPTLAALGVPDGRQRLFDLLQKRAAVLDLRRAALKGRPILIGEKTDHQQDQ